MLSDPNLKAIYLNQIQQKLDVLIEEKSSHNEDTTDYYTLKRIVDLVLNDQEILSQFNDYNEAILAMAQLDFSKRLTDNGNEDIFTYITTSLNLLSEELEYKVAPKHYLEFALEKFEGAIAITDEAGFLQYVNKDFENFTGIPKENLLNISIFSFFPSEVLTRKFKPGTTDLDCNLLQKGNKLLPVKITIESVKGINDICNGIFYHIYKKEE